MRTVVSAAVRGHRDEPSYWMLQFVLLNFLPTGLAKSGNPFSLRYTLLSTLGTEDHATRRVKQVVAFLPVTVHKNSTLLFSRQLFWLVIFECSVHLIAPSLLQSLVDHLRLEFIFEQGLVTCHLENPVGIFQDHTENSTSSLHVVHTQGPYHTMGGGE